MKKTNRFMTWLAKVLAALSRFVLLTRYRVRLHGTELLNTNQPILFLPNHQALIDPIILIGNLYKYTVVLPAISSKFYDFILIKPLFKSWGAIRVSDLERGSRNVNVLNEIARATLKGLRRGKNMVLYPSGQIASQGFERIANKKSAHVIVGRLPEEVKVIGVRIRGLWGSMWSKYGKGKSPDFIRLLLKGAFYVFANLFFFLPKRTIDIEFVDITEMTRVHAKEGRKEFNMYLEEFYNEKGEELSIVLPYYFWK